MNKRILVAVAAVLSINSLQGCIPAMIGAAAYNNAKTKKAHQEFTNNYQHNNMEREEKGLKPIDWCTEAYRFDKGWAKQDKTCAAKIKSYDKGDLEALDMPFASAAESQPTAQTIPASAPKYRGGWK